MRYSKKLNMTFPNAYTFVGLGEILWDMLPAGKQLGGAPANFAYHAQALGTQGFVASVVGEDELGNQIINCLHKLNLDQHCITVDSEHPTGTVDVQVDSYGNPTYIIHEKRAWDYLGWNEDLGNLAAKTDVVCFGSLAQRNDISRESIQTFLKHTSSACLRVFDINLRQSFYTKQIIQESLEQSNILKLNEDELLVIAEMLGLGKTETQILDQLVEQFSLRLVALTKGNIGSRLYSSREDSSHRGFEVKLEDTVGAGDSFTAAMTLGMLKGYGLEQINKYANQVACYVCSQTGATPALPPDLMKLFS